MIEVRNLVKAFGEKLAVDHISFDVAPGEVLGFLGPNGAGKSTTMRVIAGYLSADSGGVRVDGLDVRTDPLGVKRRIGYLPENAPSYGEMDVAGFLKFAGELRGLHGEALTKSVSEALETCFLTNVRNQNIDTLSKGYRHRVGLAQAIIHDPPVLILDEPTDGLDPNQKHEVRSLIRRMGKTKAIIFSTHILEEVEATCSRAIIINHGKIVASGTPGELKARGRHAGSVVLRLAPGEHQSVAEILRGLPGVAEVEALTDPSNAFRIHPKERDPGFSRSVADLVTRKGWAFESLTVEEGRLDEVFREITAATGDRRP
jgi:ABC-2 type transport system ATP-binding protein